LKPRFRKVYKYSILESEKLGLGGKDQDDFIQQDLDRARNGDFSRRIINISEIEGFTPQDVEDLKNGDVFGIAEEWTSKDINEGYIPQALLVSGIEFPEVGNDELVTEDVEFEEPAEKEQNVSRKPGRKKKV